MKILFINPLILYSGKEIQQSSVDQLCLLLQAMPEIRVVLVSVDSMDAVVALRKLVTQEVQHQIVTIANDIPKMADYNPSSGAQVQYWLAQRKVASYIIIDCFVDYYINQAELLWTMAFGMPLTEDAITTIIAKLQEPTEEVFS